MKSRRLIDDSPIVSLLEHGMEKCFENLRQKQITQLPDYKIVYPAFSPFGIRGIALNRAPVASKMALAIAGAKPIIGHSPAPADGRSLRSSNTVSMAGTSLNRGTRYCDNLPFTILPLSNSIASNRAPPSEE